MPDDPLTAALAEIMKRDLRVWDGRGNVGGLLAIGEAKDDVPRLLTALDAVLTLAGGSRAIMHGSPPEHDTSRAVGDPIAWNLDPAKVREVIARALTGEEQFR